MEETTILEKEDLRKDIKSIIGQGMSGVLAKKKEWKMKPIKRLINGLIIITFIMLLLFILTCFLQFQCRLCDNRYRLFYIGSGKDTDSMAWGN